jgi:hypothetical protein
VRRRCGLEKKGRWKAKECGGDGVRECWEGEQESCLLERSTESEG